MSINMVASPSPETIESKTLDEVCEILEGNILKMPFREGSEEFPAIHISINRLCTCHPPCP